MTKTESIQEYFYDGDGLRVSRTDNLTGLTTYYVWDSENPTGYPQVVEEIENNQVVRRYGYGLFLENVDIWNGTSFERFYVVRDGTNSVRMLLDSTGNVSAQYDYDAFGNVLNSSNTNPITIGNPYQFHSEYKDPATGLVYLRARWYVPENGRFLCKDEFEGAIGNPVTLNKYISFNDNPVNLQDPNGYFGGGFDIGSIAMAIVMAGPLATYAQPLFATNSNSTATLLFNGQWIIWYQLVSGQGTKEITRFKATSGLDSDTTGKDYRFTEYQNVKDKGPIPSGKYRMDLTNKTTVEAVFDYATRELDRNQGIQTLPPDSRYPPYSFENWGKKRARLEPLSGTDLRGRSGGFYIHDSTKGFTHGCIETESEIFPMLETYRTNHNFLDVNVGYSYNWTYGGTRK